MDKQVKRIVSPTDDFKVLSWPDLKIWSHYDGCCACTSVEPQMRENCIPVTKVSRGENQKKSVLQSTESCFMHSFCHPPIRIFFKEKSLKFQQRIYFKFFFNTD